MTKPNEKNHCCGKYLKGFSDRRWHNWLYHRADDNFRAKLAEAMKTTEEALAEIKRLRDLPW